MSERRDRAGDPEAPQLGADASNADEGTSDAPAGREDGLPGGSGSDADDAIARLTRERDEYRELLLRKTAEFDNYRKRIERERREVADAAAADVILELLPVLDNFERALHAAPGQAAGEAYRRGVELIHQEILEVLRRRGVTSIDAVGADFDPHAHEAVLYEETPGRREGEVVDELRRGYRLGDRLLRPAMVKVAKA